MELIMLTYRLSNNSYMTKCTPPQKIPNTFSHQKAQIVGIKFLRKVSVLAPPVWFPAYLSNTIKCF